MKALLAALVTAYVMPAWGVLKRLANRRDDVSVSSMTAEGVAVVSPALAREAASKLGTTWNSGELNLTATLAVRWPGRCRLELSAPDSTKRLVATTAGGRARSEGAELAAALVAIEQACAVLAVKSTGEGATREQLQKHLAGLGVDTKAVSLARFAGTVAYAVGNRADGQAQFWVYKERYQPARLLFTDQAGAAWDVRFTDYASQATADWWPRVVEVYKGAEPQLRLMVLTADPKADLSATKF
jgi:hypothetical protein